MLKKIISFLMSVLMALGSSVIISQNAYAYDRYGFSFVWKKDKVLNNSLVEVDSAVTLNSQDKVLLQWTMPEGLIDKAQTLTYHIKDSLEFVFTIKQFANHCEGTFSIFDYISGANVNLSNTKFFNPGPDVFGTIEQMPAGTDYQAINFKDANKDAINFKTTSTRGYTIRLDDVNGTVVSFKWDSTIKTVLFSTSQASPNGTYYDFNLQSPTTSQSVSHDVTLHAMTGIQDDGFNSTPFDSAQLVASAASGGAVSYIENNLTQTGLIVDQTDQATPKAPDAASDPGLYLTAMKPYFWDETNHKFYQPTSDTNTPDFVKPESISVDINMEKFTSVSITSLFSDLPLNPGDTGYVPGKPALRATKTTGLGSPDSTGTLLANEKERVINNVPGQVSVGLFGLPHSMIFSGTTVRYSAVGNTTTVGARTITHEFDCRSTTIATDKVYTFPKYNIVAYDPEAYFIELSPYTFASQIPDEKGNRQTSGGYYRILSTYTIGNQFDIIVDGIKDEMNTPRLFIPVPLSAYGGNSRTTWFKIEYSSTPFTDTKTNYTTSQSLGYTPSKDRLDLGAPQDLEILDSKVVSDEYGNEFLQLRMKWVIGLKNIVDVLGPQLDGKKISTNFYKALTPNGHDYELNTDKGTRPDKDEWATITLDMTGIPGDPFGAIIDNDTKIVTNWDLTADGLYTPGSTNPADNNQKAIIAASAGSPKNGAKITIEDSRYIINELVYAAEVTVRLPVSKGPSDPLPQFRYPGLYYITQRLSYRYDTTPTPPLTVSPESAPRALTIDGPVSYEVPQPSGVKALTPGQITDFTDPTIKSPNIQTIDLTFDTIEKKDLQNYLEYVLKPKKLTLKDDAEDSLFYNIYVTVDKAKADELMKNLSKVKDKSKLDNSPVITPFETVTINKADHYITEKYIINAAAQLADEPAGAEKTVIELLRNKEIVALHGLEQVSGLGLEQMLQIQKLDKNQTYYFIVEAYIQPFPFTIGSDGAIILDSAPISFENEFTEVSRLSVMATATTKDDPKEPDEGKAAPKAPDIFDKKDILLNGATVYWGFDPPLPADMGDYTYQYEVLRIHNFQLADIKDKGEALPDMYEKIPIGEVITNVKKYTSMDMAAWQTSGENGIVISTIPGAPAGDYEYNCKEDIWELINKDLMPNEIYFYYVRTVKTKVVGGAIVSYSTWIGLSLTTTPIEAPVDLVAERGGTFNRETEIPISFNSRINLVTGNAGKTVYKFQYAIKPDGEEWQDPVDMTFTFPDGKVPDSAREDYKHYDYTIKGLKSGRSYTIQVRMAQIVNGEWRYSQYCKPITMKTNSNQEDIIIDEKTEVWTDYFKEQLAEIVKQPYWVLDDSDSTHISLYRTSMFDGILSKTVGKELVLGKGGGNTQVFYLPSAAVEKAMANDIQFTVAHDNTYITIPAKAFDVNSSTAVIDIAEKVKARTIKDYYVKITIDMYIEKTTLDSLLWSETTARRADETEEEALLRNLQQKVNTIDGWSVVSPRIDIIVETVGSLENDLMFDTGIEGLLLQMIAAEGGKASNIKEIRDAVIEGLENEEMVKLIEELVLEVTGDFREKAQAKVKTNTAKEAFTELKLAKPMLIYGVFDTNMTVLGYKREKDSWIAVETTNVGKGKGIVTNDIGSYIFTAKRVYIPGLAGIDNGQLITEIVVKYGLDDFYGRDGTMRLEGVVTVNMVAGTAARVLGAGKTADIADFLKGKGIPLSTRNLYANASSQESIYLVMSMYEKKTNTNVKTMKITNYSLTSGIKGIEAKNLPHVRAAFEVGLLSDKNFKPNDNMTLKQLLDILVKFHNKVNLLK